MTAIMRMKKQKAYREAETAKILAEYNAASTEYDKAHTFFENVSLNIERAQIRLSQAKLRWASAREAKMEMDRCGIQPPTKKKRRKS